MHMHKHNHNHTLCTSMNNYVSARQLRQNKRVQQKIDEYINSIKTIGVTKLRDPLKLKVTSTIQRISIDHTSHVGRLTASIERMQAMPHHELKRYLQHMHDINLRNVCRVHLDKLESVLFVVGTDADADATDGILTVQEES